MGYNLDDFGFCSYNIANLLYVLGSDLRVCPKNSGKQCCSQRMEDRFTIWSKSDFSEAVPSKIEKLKDVFDDQAKIFDGKRFPLKSLKS